MKTRIPYVILAIALLPVCWASAEDCLDYGVGTRILSVTSMPLEGRGIVVQGKAKKQRIIEDARRESKILLESAQRKVESQMIAAQENIRAELIDHAIEMALEKLPAVIEEKDNQKLYEQYIENT